MQNEHFTKCNTYHDLTKKIKERKHLRKLGRKWKFYAQERKSKKNYS